MVKCVKCQSFFLEKLLTDEGNCPHCGYNIRAPPEVKPPEPEDSMSAEELSDEFQTDTEIVAALLSIAREQKIGFRELWENGYTKELDSEAVECLIRKHIRENVYVGDLEAYYVWGVARLWMNEGGANFYEQD